MMATIFLLCVIKTVLLRGYFEDPRVEIKGRYDIWFRYRDLRGLSLEELDVESFSVDWEVIGEFVVKEKKKFKDTIKLRVGRSVMALFGIDLQIAYDRLNSVDEDTVTLNTTLESEEWGIIWVSGKRSFRGREMEKIEWRFALMDVDYSSDISLSVCLFLHINPMTDRERYLMIFLPKDEIEDFFVEYGIEYWKSLKKK